MKNVKKNVDDDDFIRFFLSLYFTKKCNKNIFCTNNIKNKMSIKLFFSQTTTLTLFKRMNETQKIKKKFIYFLSN